MSDGILYWLSFPFSKQEATKSTGLSPAVNLSGLQPGLSRQSLLNGQKSFPGSRADLVLFRSFISQFMPNLCTNERGSKPSLLCSLACLNTFLGSSSFVFSLNIWHSTLIYVHGQERNKVRKWFELLGLPPLLLGAALTQPANHLDPHKGATGCCFFNVQLCALWTSTSTTSLHKLSASHFTSASLLIRRFTTGRQLTFLNTKPWSSHKCSQLPSQRQLTNMILPLKTFV